MQGYVLLAVRAAVCVSPLLSCSGRPQWKLGPCECHGACKSFAVPARAAQLACRFVPTCTPESLQGLSELAAKYSAHITSHMSETNDQVAFVAAVEPSLRRDVPVFDSYNLLTRKVRTALLPGLCLQLMHSCTDMRA